MYLLLLIIIIYITYYKYYDILDENTDNNIAGESEESEETDNTNSSNSNSIITSEYNTIPYYIGLYLRYILKGNINLDIIKTTETKKNLDKVNSNTNSFGICNENELIETKHKNVSFVCALNKVYLFLIVHNNSDIHNIINLKNKKIGISSKESNSFDILKKLCDIHEIVLSKKKEPDSFYYIDRDINTNFNLFLQKKIDALFYLSGHNLPYILSLSEKTEIRFINISSKQFEQIESLKFKKTKMNIENYNTRNDSFYLETYYTRNILVCNKFVDTTLVYNITKQIIDNIELIKRNLNKIGKQYFNDSQNFFYDDFDIPKMAYIYKTVSIHKGAYNYYKQIKIILDEKNCAPYKNDCIKSWDELNYDMKYKMIK